MKTTLRGEIVKDYLSRFPNAATRTLALLIYKENSEVYKDSESVRTLLRMYRGAAGERALKKLTDKTFVKEHGNTIGFAKLPEGITTLDGWDLLKIAGDYKALILSDVHVPFHSKKVIELAVEKGKKLNADLIILNGDWLDFYSLSQWVKDPRLRNFPDELNTARESLLWIREQFPKARIIFKVGNHEERYENYMMVKAPEYLGIDDFELSKMLRLDQLGMEYITDKRPIKLNELFIIHGHEYKFNISNPVNPARGLYLRSKVNAICGHFHQSSSHSENNIEDDFTTCWSTGHLAEPHPRYMPLNKWNHGFAFVESSGDKFFQVNNYKIIDYHIYNA